MSQTANGGSTGQLSFTDLKQAYDVYWTADLFKKSSLFQNAIQSYSSKGFATSLTYGAKTISLADGSQYLVPAMTFLGYTAAETALIDQFYGALTQRLATDTGFRQSPAMRAFVESQG